jgi:hypothetical protein
MNAIIEGEAEEVPAGTAYSPPPPPPPVVPPAAEEPEPIDPTVPSEAGTPVTAPQMMMPPDVMAGTARAMSEAAAAGGQLRITRRVPETGEWMIVVEMEGGGFNVLGWVGDEPATQHGAPVSTLEEAHNAVETLATGVAPSQAEPPPPPKTLFSDDPEARLAWAKERAKEKIDGDAERARLKYITPGAGQAMEYLASEQEADQVMMVGPRIVIPDNPALFPFLRAEASARGTTIYEAAQATAQAAAQWRQVGSVIKSLRLTGKATVMAAETEEAVWAATNIVWPAPA